MAEEGISLQRKNGEADEYGFESLKREGLRLIQELSGKIWTDYNPHDPGVTILEQVCYALTDLIYRTDFPVEDYLTGGDGRIDFTGQALHPPEDILPCRPVTFADYRKILFDSLPEIDNVWVTKAEDAGPSGLCRIAIRLCPEATGHEREIAAKAAQVYCRNRNLCEDLAGVTVVREEECELHARIEVTGGMEPADVLAGIYHACSRHIAGGMRPRRLDEALASGLALDELLDGPAVSHGVVLDGGLENNQEEILIANLFALAGEAAGVNGVKRLWLRKDGVDYFDAIENSRKKAMLRLRVPKRPEEIHVRLESASGRALHIPFQDFRARYGDLAFMDRSRRRAPDDLSTVHPLPGGTHRNLRDYFSIQNHFPAIYGVNSLGVPESAPADVKGRAAQLKGYLLLFDQIMANCAANLDQLGNLFSLAGTGRQTYFTQLVRNSGHPPLDSIYPDAPDQALASLVRNHDAYHDRKNRLLDYLLALYGESFPGNALRNFAIYAAPHEREDALLEAKAACLRSVAAMGKDRGGAFDYTEAPDAAANVSGFERRISLLLGFNSCPAGRLTRTITSRGIRLAALAPGDAAPGGAWFGKAADAEGGQAFERVPLVAAAGMDSAETLFDICRKMIPALGAVFPEQLLRSGISQENFRMARPSDNGEILAVFKDEDAAAWRSLAIFPDAGSAINALNALQRLCCQLNGESEGVRVVEHILLRPRSTSNHWMPVDADFYPFRMTLLFPAWTARCHDAKFRELAENLVVANTPAHVHPDIFWLDFEEMSRFETLFNEWLHRRRETRNFAPLDEAARGVIEFLLNRADAAHG